MKDILEIKKVNIHLKTEFGPVVSLKHEFALRARGEDFFTARILFSLPKHSVISAFEISGGKFRVKSELNRAAARSGASVTQKGLRLYELSIGGLPARGEEFSVSVCSAAIMEHDRAADEYYIDLPLYTENRDGQKTVDIEARPRFSVTAFLSGGYGAPSAGAQSLTPVVWNGQSGTVLFSEPKAGGDFRLRVSAPEKRNIGYISKKPGGGFYCMYIIRSGIEDLAAEKALAIREYAPGTFYMVPQIYRGQYPLIITLGSETAFPDRFYAENGGSEREIAIDEFIEVNNKEMARAFAARTIDAMYGMIGARGLGELSAESVIKLKKQAAALAFETETLCPENSCVIEYGDQGGERAVTVSLWREGPALPESGELSDTGFITAAQAEKIIFAAVAALLQCARTDGSITGPAEENPRAAAEQTAYAAAALDSLADRFPVCAELSTLACEFLSKSGVSRDVVPVVYDSLSLNHCGDILRRQSVREISRLILSIKRGLRVSLS